MPPFIQQLDEMLLIWIAEHLRWPVLDPLVCLYTQLGNGGRLFIALALVLLLFRRTRKAGVCALLGMFFGLLVTNLTIKPLVARARPWLVIPDFMALVGERDPHSFPSGHSCSAFAFGTAVAAASKERWLRISALTAAVLMALSRLYVGVHFPSDVLAGAAIGAACGLLAAWLVKQWLARRELGRRENRENAPD